MRAEIIKLMIAAACLPLRKSEPRFVKIRCNCRVPSRSPFAKGLDLMDLYRKRMANTGCAMNGLIRRC